MSKPDDNRIKAMAGLLVVCAAGLVVILVMTASVAIGMFAGQQWGWLTAAVITTVVLMIVLRMLHLMRSGKE